ncbi:MAG: L,D-transpeptidase family protein [Phycisphaerae bacterium]
MSRTRASRALIALLCVTIVLGIVAYIRTPKTTTASETPKVTGPDAAAVAPKPAEPAKLSGRSTQIALGGSSAALVTQTPVGAPPAVAPTTATPAATAGAPATPVKIVTPTGPVAPPPAVPAKSAVEVPAAPAAAVDLSKSGGVIAQGKALIDASKLVEGRRLLNEALVGGQLSDADADAAKALIGQANQTLIFSPTRITGDTYVTGYTVQSGDKPGKIAAGHDVTWDFLGRINGIADARKLRAGATIKVVRGPFHAVVSKSKYTLDLYLGSPGEKGSMFVRTFKVGHGKNNSTPTGSWMVTPQNKLKNPKWWGTADEPAKEADDPQNPLGEFWIGLTGTGGEAVDKQGFGVHGTIDPDSIGKQMSHGCVRLVNADIQMLYEVLIEGKSTIIIKD